MAMGSGLGQQAGFKNETTYGTRLAADHFVRPKVCTINKISHRAQGSGLQAGGLGEFLDHFTQTHEEGTGHLEIDIVNKGIGLLIQALMGTSVTPTLISGSAFSQTHTLADPYGKSLTLQTGVPLRSGGTAICKELQGAVITSAEFSCGIGEYLNAKFDFDGQKLDTAQTLATASYSSTVPFAFDDGAIKTGVFNSEVALTDSIRAVSIKFDRPKDTGDFTYGAAGLKNQPVLNDLTHITGTLLADYTTASKAALEDRFHGLTSTSLVWDFTQSTAISGAIFPEFRITLPSIIFDGDSSNPNGPAEITGQYPFTWKYDGTNLPVIYIASSDSTL